MRRKETKSKLEETQFLLKLKGNLLNIHKTFLCFSILMISLCFIQQSWSAAFPDELRAENLFNEQTFRTLAQREDLEDEDELDRLARSAHGEEDGRSMVSGMTALSIASSQFFSTDKAEIARKLQTRIGRLHGEATVIIRNRRSFTVELEEAGDIDPLKNAALRLTFERFYPEVPWQENTLVIPWESLVDTHVRHFQRDFNAAEASVRRHHQAALEAQLEQLRGEQQRAQASRNPRLALLGPIIRRDTDFENTGQDRLGGSSYSSGVFRERGTGDLWLGKSDPRMTTAEALEVNEAQTESEVSREKLSCDIYAYYGAVVPRTELSRQRLTNTAFPEHRELYGVHLMSHLMEGFRVYTEQQDFDLSHPNRGGHIHIPNARGTLLPIPEKGLGTILAIAAFINDVDVIAGGGNIGYQLLHTEQGQSYAQTVKIDSGAAFNNNPEITVPPRFIRTALQADPSSLSFERLPAQTQEEFLLTLHQINRTTERELILFFTREGAEKFVLRDERGVQGIVNQLLSRQERLRQEYALDLTRTRGTYERLQAQQREEEQERLRLVNLRQQDIDATDHRRIEEQARLRMRVEDLTRDQRLQQQRLQQAQRAQAEERERAERERAESQAQLGYLQQNLQELQRNLPTEREARLRAERDVERLQNQIEQERVHQEQIRAEQREQERQRLEREGLQLREEERIREEERLQLVQAHRQEEERRAAVERKYAEFRRQIEEERASGQRLEQAALTPAAARADQRKQERQAAVLEAQRIREEEAREEERRAALAIIPPRVGSDIVIPEIAKGHEETYLRFLRGMLIYRPDPDSDRGRIDMPIAALLDPLRGTFDLSGCGHTGKYLSISTGYKTGLKPENANKLEIWFAPRFLIEKEPDPTARHFRRIMSLWDADTAPIGIFWTWGGWDNLDSYDFLAMENGKANTRQLHRHYERANIMVPYQLANIIFGLARVTSRFHVHFVGSHEASN